MDDQQVATAILALEECIEQYIAECRGRVEGFVERHFSLQETIVLQKQSLVSDLLCHPINALWSIPSLFVKKLIEVPMKLGWRSGTDVITLVPTGLKTRYQRQIERLIAIELLDWPSAMGDRQASPNGLLERMKRHKQVGSLLASGSLSDDALRGLSDIPHLVAKHSAGRVVVLDTAAPVLTLATGWLFFGDHSLGISGIGGLIARNRAKEEVASTFVYVRIKFRIGILFGFSSRSIILASHGGHAHCRACCYGNEPSRRTGERFLSEAGGFPACQAGNVDRCGGR